MNKKEITLTILKLVAFGGVVVLAATFPGACHIAKLFDWKGKKKYEEAYSRCHYLYKNGFIKAVKISSGYQIVLTKKGKKKYEEIRLKGMNIRFGEWDGKWRVLTYDVPTSFRTIRNRFRKDIVSLGFVKLQQSVYVTPYKCDDVIEQLEEVYGDSVSIFLFVTYRINSKKEKDLKKKFKLNKQFL